MGSGERSRGVVERVASFLSLGPLLTPLLPTDGAAVVSEPPFASEPPPVLLVVAPPVRVQGELP